MKKIKVEKPWGNFEQFCHNERVTVKLLHVNANEELSLQYHHNRDEFWKVIAGTGSIIIGDKIQIGNVGDEFFIKKEERHQIKTTNSSLSILEISNGNFDENDIVRLMDKYNRIR